jgi:hypothetical protein
MKALFARLLLTAFFAIQVAIFGATQTGATPMLCCPAVATETPAKHSHCPPVGGAPNSCCPDCPVLLAAMLPIETAGPPSINLPQIATFPALSLRASSRVEEPPVPPPRMR